MEPSLAPAQIKEWLECLFWFAGFIAALLYVIKQVRGDKPHPPNERLGQSQEQLEERVKAIEDWRDELTTKLDRDKQEILLSGSQRGQRIYAKIDHEIGKLSDRMDDMRKELTEKCEAIPNVVIATLVNAKRLTND